MNVFPSRTSREGGDTHSTLPHSPFGFVAADRAHRQCVRRQQLIGAIPRGQLEKLYVI